MKRNWLEWLILGVSTLLVIGVVGFLLVSGLTNSGPAVIRASASMDEAIEGPDGGWLVPLQVRNEGGSAAVAIVVEGTATVDGAEETSELAVDILAGGSVAELVLGFSGRPEGEVTVRVVGFETP